MDGVVVVVERGGALHYTRSFSARFDRFHAKSDRMNLAALLFALQNFSGDSIRDQTNDDDDGAVETPPITLFETAAERIVMARSRSRGLLIALFVRPQWDAATARSLVGRMALYYDGDSDVESRLHQNSRIFREACTHAIEDEVDACLHKFAASMFRDDNTREASRVGFVLLHYVSPASSVARGADGHGVIHEDDDDGEHDLLHANAPSHSHKESRLTSPRLTGSITEPSLAQRLQTISTATRSKFPRLRKPGGDGKPKPKKNAVLNYADPKSFNRFVRFPHVGNHAMSSDENVVATVVNHPQFPQALVASLQPHLADLDALLLPSSSSTPGVTRPVIDGTWRNFLLPPLVAATSNARATVPLRFWVRDGCVVVHIDTRCSVKTVVVDGHSERTHAAALFDRVDPLAQCALKLMA